MRIITVGIFTAALLVAGTALAQTTAEPQSTTATIAGATHGTGFGLGVAAMLTNPAGLGALGVSGLSLAYDAGPWHLDTLFGLSKNEGPGDASRPSFVIGGRFWFHVHRSANSDFSVGGGLAFDHLGPSHQTVVAIEGGAQLRAFIVSNVALAFSAGLGIDTIDRSQVIVGGQFVGTAAVHYYFY
jgi:hypothetical protein